MKKFLILLSLVLSTGALAAGGVQPKDWSEFFPTLIWPAINVLTLATALFFILRKPVLAHFNSRSEEVSKLMASAEDKSKQADMLMKKHQEKMNNLDSEISQIKNEVEDRVKTFSSEYEREVEDRITKLKTDAAQKIEAEKKSLDGDLNNLLLDEVIKAAKTNIRNDKDLGEKATKNILEGL